LYNVYLVAQSELIYSSYPPRSHNIILTSLLEELSNSIVNYSKRPIDFPLLDFMLPGNMLMLISYLPIVNEENETMREDESCLFNIHFPLH
jgi:hypothetical protein